MDTNKFKKYNTEASLIRMKENIEPLFNDYQNNKVNNIRKDVRNIEDVSKTITYEDFVSSNEIVLELPLTESKDLVVAKWRNSAGRWYVFYHIYQSFNSTNIRVVRLTKMKYSKWKEFIKLIQKK